MWKLCQKVPSLPLFNSLKYQIIAKCAHEMPETQSSFSLPGWCQHGQLTTPDLSFSCVLFVGSRL